MTLLPVAAQGADGASEGVRLRPGFARLALLLEVAEWGGGSGLQVHVQHSADGRRWMDLAAFQPATGPEAQVVWVEAQAPVAGSVEPALDGGLPAGTVHAGFACSRLRVRWSLGGGTHRFGVDVVAIYERRSG